MKALSIRKEVTIMVDSVQLDGWLTIPKDAKGVIIFSHGTGSIKHRRRNMFVSKKLNESGLATLIFDPLTYEEDQDNSKKYNLDLHTKRMVLVTKWVHANENTKDLAIGYFGADTGAAIALMATTQLKDIISAIVCRGGRPDLANHYLPKVKVPTLFLVGRHDYYVTEQNQEAFRLLGSEEKEIVLAVDDESDFAEEQNKLEDLTEMVDIWFRKYVIEEEVFVDFN